MDYLPRPYNQAWFDGLTRLVQQLRGIGAQVLVLGPVPNPHKSVPICLSGHLDDATACSSPRSTAVNQPGIAAETAATKAGGGQYDDLTELFCTTDRCPVIVGNTLVYFDGSRDDRIRAGARTGNGGAGRPHARPRLTVSAPLPSDRDPAI